MHYILTLENICQKGCWKHSGYLLEMQTQIIITHIHLVSTVQQDMIGNVILGLTIGLSHHVAIFLRSTILKYLDKKPLGLQSVLDLLIKDLIWCQMIQATLWIIFLLAGSLHGKLPICTAEIGLFIILNCVILVYAQYQVLLVVKALLIFKGSHFSS